ncbi:MAG: hypothetical protein Q8Q33_01270 [Chlamydiota bacterium]|nr:hypothetical protein [Chlamydiota bacterium]
MARITILLLCFALLAVFLSMRFIANLHIMRQNKKLLMEKKKKMKEEELFSKLEKTFNDNQTSNNN